MSLCNPDGPNEKLTALCGTGTTWSLLSPRPGFTVKTDPVLSKLCIPERRLKGLALDIFGVGGKMLRGSQAYYVDVFIGGKLSTIITILVDKSHTSLPRLLLGLQTMTQELSGVDFRYVDHGKTKDASQWCS